MRYTDTREKSAEFLRAAIQLMGQHVASFNPVSFAVWYEHSAGANASLSKAISERLAAKEVFDDETTDQLFRDHIADPGDSEIDGVSEELQRTMARLVDKASLTGQRADAFGVQLAELSATLATKRCGRVVRCNREDCPGHGGDDEFSTVARAGGRRQ
jgi:diguanylate cyclase